MIPLKLKQTLYLAWILLGLSAFFLCNRVHPFSWNYGGNCVFEFLGSLFLLQNIFVLWRDKKLRGFHWVASTYFMGWGYWNILYYPSVGDWYSFTGGLFIVTANTVWVAMQIYYRKN